MNKDSETNTVPSLPHEPVVTDNVMGNGGGGTTPPETSSWEPSKVGGKIHKLLNLTWSRKLTLGEYQKLVKLIGSVFDRTSSEYKRGHIIGVREGMEIVNNIHKEVRRGFY